MSNPETVWLCALSWVNNSHAVSLLNREFAGKIRNSRTFGDKRRAKNRALLGLQVAIP